MTHLSLIQHETRQRLLRPERDAGRPTRFTPLAKRARRRRLLGALRPRLA
ncbi:MAG TPA: hypothetical protein VK915_00745 [Gaiellaceae bacterium]|nr:hypothetical protein [Gaiellaceae bacterium]